MARGLTGKPGRKVSPKVMSALCRIDTRAGDKAAGTAPEGFMGSSYQTRGWVGQRKKPFPLLTGVALQKENLRYKSNEIKARTATEAQYATTVAAVKKTEYEELQALLGYTLAVADLKRITGSYLNP